MNKLLQPFFDSRRSVPLYLLGTAVTTLIIQFGVDWSNNPKEWRGSYTLTLIVIALALAALLIFKYQTRPQSVYLLPEQKPRPHRGLILLVSKHKAASPRIIQYHQGTLTHCWLIATSQSAKIAAELADDFAGHKIKFYFGSSYQVFDDDAASTHRLVKKILVEEAPAKGLNPADLIADITGGSKPMTAGLFLACINESVPVEYVVTKKDTAGIVERDNKWGEPIKISTTFIPSSTRES